MNALVFKAGTLLGLSEDQWNPEEVGCSPVCADGSQRLLYRLTGPGGQRVLVIEPPAGDEAGLREARSAWNIGRHLYAQGVPVPELYGFEEANGRLFVEDLGDQRLHELLTKADELQQRTWYLQVIAHLVQMQVHGIRDFSASWCWDTPCYDQRLMLERESGYFLQALCRDYLEISYDHDKAAAECRLLAERASRAPSDFFLHRDFQSRNIMVTKGTVRFIDFQGGRRGPLGYDLASLLIDPYIGLSESLQEELRQAYCVELNRYISYDPIQFNQEYLLLALQRNLQILGAFSFLSQQRGKMFFARFIEPALHSLNSLLAKPESADYACLREIASQCLFLIEQQHDH